MSTWGTPIRLLFLSALFCVAFPSHGAAQWLTTPQPGDIWKEYVRFISTSNDNFRVTDPNTTNATAQTFLPNDRLSYAVNDLQGMTRAEIVLDTWGGHCGTTGKKFRFNNGPWITIPEMGAANGIPAGHTGQCYMQSVSYVIPIPADYFNASNAYRIVQGNNIMEATSGGQSCYNFNWGQWTWHGTILRVYFNSSKPHSTGSITSPAAGTTIGEDPTVTASVSGNVSQVDFLAYYDGYDWDGDGIAQQYHHMYHRTKAETSLPIKRHIGSRTSAPWSVTWDTELVPEQAAGSVKLLARIRDANGVWYMSPEVISLTLQRSNSFVKIYRTVNIPERFWVRSGRTTGTVTFSIPASDNLANAVSASLLINTWNGDDVSERALSYMKINNYTLPDFGADHWFSSDVISFSKTHLVNGTNTFTIFASTVEHGIEVMWPGPAVLVRYNGTQVNTPPQITQHPQSQTVNVGQTAIFIVAAVGTAPFTYQWQKNNVNISGATLASYAIPAAVIGDNGATFRCVVTNNYGNATSNSATLTVTNASLPPTITLQPADQTVAVGQTATFTVSATGTPPLSYQWQLNGVDIAGAAASSHTTPPAQLANNGFQYRCVVSNTFGTATSTIAILGVSEAPPPAPNIVANPQFEPGTTGWTFYTDGAATFASVAPGYLSEKAARIAVTTPGTNVQLYQSNLRLEPNTDYVLSFAAYSNTGHDLSVSLLKQTSPFPNYGLSNAVFNLGTGWQVFTRQFRTGGFTSPVTDGRLRFWFAPYDAAGDEYHIDAVLLRKALAGPPPVIVTQPQPQTVTIGQTAVFSVVATGTLPIAYQWQKDGVNITGATAASYTTPPATAGDNGALFRCIVSNSGGIEISNVAALTVVTGPPTGGPWWNTAWRYRVRVTSDPGSTARTDRSSEVRLNFTSLLEDLGVDAVFNDASIRVIEVTSNGAILDTLVPAQFDRDSLYEASSNAEGVLVILMKGSTPANGLRYYDVYFDTASGFTPPAFLPAITWTDDVMYQGQSSFQIATATATYYYHKLGGGFAAMIDGNGNDWISYRPTGGSAGEYRGIPNLGDVFHPGYTNSSSRVLGTGPLKLTLVSTSTDGLWDCTWEIYHRFARFRLNRRGATNYWFLYEGTPGGTFGATADYVVRSNGLRTRADVTWAGDLAAPEWAYFGDSGMRRILYLAHHENDTQPDMYRQMEGNMTIFGFGRDNVPCCPRYLTAVPQHFTIGFAEDSSYASASPVIAAASADVIVTIALPEVQPVVRQPAVSGMVTGPASEIPTKFALEQNFPNPFNPATTIGYEVPEATAVTIRLYDLLGREVGTLVDGVHLPGRYQVQWNAEDLPSGVYLYRMQAGAFVAHRRLVLLR